MKNKIILIWSFCVLLLITFLLSFTKNSENDKRKALKTALLNPKNKENLYAINLSDSTSKITILKEKSTDLWIIYNNYEKSKLYCNQLNVTNFINNLSAITNLYKISNKMENPSFGFDSENSITVSYELEHGQVTQLKFGNHDFSGQYRYLKSNENSAVYEISSQIDTYLSTAVQSWANPLLIPQEIFSNLSVNDIQKITVYDENTKILTNSHKDFQTYAQNLLDLRHGGLQKNKNLHKVCNIKVEFGDKSILTIEIYSTSQENEFNACINYVDFQNQIYKWECKISSWTYNKINTSKL